MREATAQLAQTGIKGVEDAIFSLMTTGTANFREFAVSILQDTTRMIIQQLILRTIMQAIGAIGGGPKGGDSISQFISGANQYKMNANGNVYAQNGIQPFAMGGIVNKPTLFKYADGGAGRFGLMGEAGPEAIIPLKRGRDGKLGVAGGGSVAVTVNVDAQGTKVQGDNGQGQQLGRAVAAAVQAELIKQKRPGGLLA
jgi:lambda family phage tail tape measure protein